MGSVVCVSARNLFVSSVQMDLIRYWGKLGGAEGGKDMSRLMRSKGKKGRKSVRDSIRAISPGEDVREAPRSYLGFGLFARGMRHFVGEFFVILQ